MRIVLASDIYPPVVSGVSTVVDKTSRALAREGHEVMVVAPGTPPYSRKKISPRLTHYALLSIPNFIRENSSLGLAPSWHLKSSLIDFKPDLVHIHSTGTVAFSMLKAARQADIPVVVTLHGIPQFVTAYAAWLPRGFKHHIHKVMWKFGQKYFRQLSRIIVPSRYLKNEMLKNGVTKPITVLPMWIENQIPNKNPQFIRSKYRLPSGKKIILYMGRLDPDKNLTTLLRSLALLKTKFNTDFHCMIAGDGASTVPLKKLAQELQLASLITWTDFASEKEKANLLYASDVFVIPSTIETQSLITLEAIRTGLPALVADIAALPELAKKFRKQIRVFHPYHPDELAMLLNSFGLKQRRFPPLASLGPEYTRESDLEGIIKIYNKAKADG